MSLFSLATIMILSVTADVSFASKATDKCEEFSKAVYSEEEAAVLLPGSTKQKSSNCGIVEVPLVVGGEKAGPKEFPHMVAIGYGAQSDIKWQCGGSLVSDQHVLTAAHCSSSPDWGSARWAHLGDVNLAGTNKDGNPQVVAVLETVVHPDYKPPSQYNDIAVIKLVKKVKFDAYIRPACLHTGDEVPVKAIASGFGKLKYESDQGSPDLMKVTVSRVDEEQCKQTYRVEAGTRRMQRGLVKSMMCFGELAGEKDTCQGDSGGPLQIVLASPYCMYSIVGVTSFGKSCGFANSPAIYTRVSVFIPWIESIIWP